MKVAATLNFVTHASERTELVAQGYLEKSAENVLLGYEGDGYAMRFTLCAEYARIVRTGADGYNIVLREGADSVLELAAGSVPVHTEKLLYKCSEHKIRFAADYNLGGANPIKLILKVTY